MRPGPRDRMMNTADRPQDVNSLGSSALPRPEIRAIMGQSGLRTSVATVQTIQTTTTYEGPASVVTTTNPYKQKAEMLSEARDSSNLDIVEFDEPLGDNKGQQKRLAVLRKQVMMLRGLIGVLVLVLVLLTVAFVTQ